MACEMGTIKLGDSLATFMWSLDIGLFRGRKPEESIWSPSFSTLIPGNDKAEWLIQLYPNGLNRKFKGYLSIYLHNTNDCNVLDCKSLLVYFSVIGQENDKFEDVPVEDLSVPSRVRGLDQFIKRDLLINRTSYFYDNSSLVEDDKVTIRCCIKMSVIEQTKPNPPPQHLKPNKPRPSTRSRSLNNLLIEFSEYSDSEESDSSEATDDFESLLKSGRSDVIFLAGGTRVHAHKAVLAMRSTVFANQFEKDKLEKRQKSIIDAGDLDLEILKKVLRFVYLNHITNLEESAHEMLGPATQYALDDLKDLCEDAMIKHLTIFNASDYLKLSFDHDALTLRAHALKFWTENREAIMETPGFQNLTGSNNCVIVTMIAVAASPSGDKNKSVSKHK